VKPIRWTTGASDQLEAAIKRIQQTIQPQPENVAQAVVDSIEQLATFPGLGDSEKRREPVNSSARLTWLCVVSPKRLSRSCTSARRAGLALKIREAPQSAAASSGFIQIIEKEPAGRGRPARLWGAAPQVLATSGDSTGPEFRGSTIPRRALTRCTSNSRTPHNPHTVAAEPLEDI